MAIQVTLKLYASLGTYLPAHAARNEVPVEVADQTTIAQLLERYNVPLEACHMVLLNGVFQPPASRGGVTLQEGDALAAWPPVAGG